MWEKKGQIERRSGWRADTGQFLVEFKSGKWISKTGKGNIRNISEAGLFFITQAEFKKGNPVQIELHLPPQFPGAKPVPLKCKVVRVVDDEDRFGVGCRIEHAGSEALEVIQQLMWWLELKVASE